MSLEPTLLPHAYTDRDFFEVERGRCSARRGSRPPPKRLWLLAKLVAIELGGESISFQNVMIGIRRLPAGDPERQQLR